MSIHYFTDEQVKALRKNQNVKRASHKAITYTKAFKEYFLIENVKGKLPKEIFESAGFDVDALGMIRIRSSGKRWRQQQKRLEGVKDTRKGGSGRPRTKHLSKDEIIERQKAEIEYLKQERKFLLELERLERLAIKKEKLSLKKNTTSSKES
jgi:hypothetical protein